MKNILKLFAIYNKDINNGIIKILSNLSEKDLYSERITYQKTIYNLFIHIVQASWYYQNGILKISDGKYCKYLKEKNITKEQIQSSLSDCIEILQILDEGLIDFIDNISDEDFNLKKNNIKIYNGRVVDLSIWQLITQYISHQIHHKGQLSQLLDEINITHDFGNIFPYVQDSLNKEQ